MVFYAIAAAVNQSSLIIMRRLLYCLFCFCYMAIPSFSDDIIFADQKVKALCVANWDVDNNGELSTDEAAIVESLGSVFREQAGISTFEELRYFTGLAAINDYAFYKSSITTVSFPENVKAIGEYAFSESNIGPKLIVPGTVKKIEAYSFYNCAQLNSVLLEDGVEEIGYEAFNGPIGYMSLSSTLTSIKDMFINPYVNAAPGSGVFVPKGDFWLQVHASTPPSINMYAFYYVFASGHIIVPFGCVEAYKDATAWSYFNEYLEAGDVNGDGALNIKDVVSLNAYIMGNNPSPFDVRLADLNGDGKINVKDVTLMCSWIMNQKQ